MDLLQTKLKISLQDYLIEKWYEHIMETLKCTQWIIQCVGCFAVSDGDIWVFPKIDHSDNIARIVLVTDLVKF